MATTRLRHRIFFLLLAVMFFVTAFALSFLVIWQGHQNNQAQKAAQAAANVAVCKTVTPSAAVVNVEKKGHPLQGTELADFTPCKVSKLQIIDVKVGTGPAVTPSDTVTVDYTGAIADTGVVFQSSLDSGQPVPLALNQVIPGWTEGIPGMKVGGIRRLLIPASLAYAANPPSCANEPQPCTQIPANADLVFDITLHKIGS